MTLWSEDATWHDKGLLLLLCLFIWLNIYAFTVKKKCSSAIPIIIKIIICFLLVNSCYS